MKSSPEPKPVIYRTPGRECPHADKGCCPRCQNPKRFRFRFTSRTMLPTSTAR